MAARELAEEEHAALGLDPVLLDHLLVGRDRATNHALERPGERLVGHLALGLDDAAVLAPPGCLADDALVPAQLQPAWVERIDLAARLKDDADDCGHVRSSSCVLPGLVEAVKHRLEPKSRMDVQLERPANIRHDFERPGSVARSAGRGG